MLVELPDGRVLDVVAGGPEDGTVLLFHTGTPSGPVLLGSLVEAAARRGLRTVVYGRPGYGASTAAPGRSVSDVAADTTALLDALGANTFVTLGWSGGGPHALACAAMLPERCLAAGSIAGVAPHEASGLDWLAGMGAENIEEFGAARAGEAELTAYLTGAADGLDVITADSVAASLGDLVSEPDIRQLTGELAEYLAASFRAAVSSGIAGWRDDDLAFVRPWGFDLAAAGPVSIWQGGQDRMVPATHGSWLVDAIPGARAHLLPEEGHLSLMVSGVDAILDELLDSAQARQR